MATRMQLVRHLPNDTARRKIGFTLTDEQAKETKRKLALPEHEQKTFFQFTDATLMLRQLIFNDFMLSLHICASDANLSDLALRCV